jgi:hypothetical protein
MPTARVELAVIVTFVAFDTSPADTRYAFRVVSWKELLAMSIVAEEYGSYGQL